MRRRRELLSAVAGGIALGSLGTAFATGGTGSASLQWANELDEAVQLTTTLDPAGGVLGGGGTHYEAEHRIYPTGRYRSVETNVVETGTYRVAVAIEGPESVATADPYTTTWKPAGCRNQDLVITVTGDGDVEFSQKEC